MPAKEVKFSADARDRMLRGVNILVDVHSADSGDVIRAGAKLEDLHADA